jgi:phospholipid transport system substrate-binding protein
MVERAVEQLGRRVRQWLTRFGVAGAHAVGSLVAVAVASVGVSAAMIATAGAHAEEPIVFMKARQREVEEVLRSKAGAARHDALVALLEAHMDFDDFTHRSLGYQWSMLTATQQSQYRALLKALVERVHIRKLGEEAPHYKLTWNDAATNDDRARISFVLRREDIETEVDFDLRRVGDSWVVLDVSYDGLSAAANYQKKYGKVLREQGFEALIAKMQRRLEEVQ